MPLQQGNDLLPIAQLPMMFLLLRDVCLDSVQLGLADAESGLPSLPRKSSNSLIGPPGGIRLELLHEVGEGEAGRKNEEQMHMVFGAINQ